MALGLVLLLLAAVVVLVDPFWGAHLLPAAAVVAHFWCVWGRGAGVHLCGLAQRAWVWVYIIIIIIINKTICVCVRVIL